MENQIAGMLNPSPFISNVADPFVVVRVRIQVKKPEQYSCDYYAERQPINPVRYKTIFKSEHETIPEK